MENPVGLLIAAGGVFCIAGAALDWDLFMESRKASLFVALFGRNGARVFYIFLGVAIVVLGALISLGVLRDAK